jgi:hypothetical protein
MVERPNNPIDKVRELQRRLYIAAKRNEERRFHARAVSIWRCDDPLEAWYRYAILEACMLHEKTIGKPDAGNPHVRICGSNCSSSHTSPDAVDRANYWVAGATPIGGVASGAPAENSARRVVMLQSRTTVVPPRAAGR